MKKYIHATYFFAILLLILTSCNKNEDAFPKQPTTATDLIKKYGLKVSDQVTKANSKNFATVAEADRFLDSIKNAKPVTILVTTRLINQNQGLQKALASSLHIVLTSIDAKNTQQTFFAAGDLAEGPYTVKYGNIVNGYGVDLTPNNNFSSIGASGYLYGFTIGTSFTQTSYSTSYDGSAKVISFQVNGTQNYNIFFQSIGTIYSGAIKMVGTYNVSSGQGVMTVSNN